MQTVTADDITRMRGQLFVEGPDRNKRLSRFWVLLVLAAIIATAGVVGDSTATVIGAMIVAPLMTPILGIVLGVVLGDRANSLRSIGLVLAGAAAVVVLAWAIGLVLEAPVTAATNSQVAGRVHPRLIDLLAALATGVVGSFALVRSDISDTLPGVAIAISLVPPLAVVGLTLEAGETGQAGGAFLLFVTNVAAILVTGIIVMAIFSIHRQGTETGELNRVNAVLLVVLLVVVVVVPLAASTRLIARDTRNEQQATAVATSWAGTADWDLVRVKTGTDSMTVTVSGSGEGPDPQVLREQLDDVGLSAVTIEVELVPLTKVELPGG